MASIIPGYEYDIFISYRQKDNKGDRWVSEFVDALKTELESTFKEEISVYFDINPHDGLLETHDVNESLKDKLKCLIFIPILSRTYCDPKSFAWEHEFKAFIMQASQDQFGLKIKLPNGNVANRVLPVRIHELDEEDIKLCESVLNGALRGVDFIYKEPGVDRPLIHDDDDRKNLNKTKYRNQVNKVSLAIKEVISAIKKNNQPEGEVPQTVVNTKPHESRSLKSKIIITAIIIVLLVPGYLLIRMMLKLSSQVEKSIAVLPFRNDSPVDSNKYFINGLMEHILNNLQTISDLRVISRTSAEKYRNTTKSIPEIAEELGVNYIVEGSGQKSGNVIHLSVQLLRAGKEQHLMGKSYEKELKDARDIFKIQSEIAELIAAELKAVITPQVKQRLEKAATTNLAAYEFVLRGSYHHNRFTPNDYDIALDYYEKALEIDPEYVLAYSGISMIWYVRSLSQVSPEEALPKAIAACNKALELDSAEARVHTTLTYIQMTKWDWKGAEFSSKKAIELNSESASHITYAQLLTLLGRFNEANEHNELALKLDPLNPGLKSMYGYNLFIARRYEEALKIFHEVLKTDPGNFNVLNNLPVILHQLGRYSEEMEAWKQYLSNEYKNIVHVFDMVNARGGYADVLNLEADSLLAQSNLQYIAPFDIAVIYACAGNKEKAMEMLELAYEKRDISLPWMVTYPVFDNLHNEPRFREIASRIGLSVK